MSYKTMRNRHLHWVVHGGGLYFVDHGKEYEVDKVAILANGTRDVCIIEDREYGIRLKLIEEAKRDNDKILHIPKTDVGIFYFKDVPPSLGYRILYMDILEDVKPMIDLVVQRFKVERREDYDAYLGTEYGDMRE